MFKTLRTELKHSLPEQAGPAAAELLLLGAGLGLALGRLGPQQPVFALPPAAVAQADQCVQLLPLLHLLLRAHRVAHRPRELQRP